MIKLRLVSSLLIVFVAFMLSCSGENKSSDKLSRDAFDKLEVNTIFEFTESDEVAFQSINAVKVDPHGNILVRDFYHQHISMFDQQGKLIQKIGNQGKGPGEFQSIGSFLTTDSLLMISDRQKIEVFTFEGDQYIHSHGISFKAQEHAGSLLAMVNNEILIRKGEVIRADQQDFSPVRKNKVSKLDQDSEVITDTLFTYPSLESLITSSGEFLSMVKTFGNRGFEASDGEERIYTSWSEELKVDYFTIQDGQEHHAFSYDVTPVEITSGERDSVLRDMEDPHRSEMRKQFPAVKPLINSMLVDDQQRIWMELNAEKLGNHWFAFSIEGEPLYVIEKPNPDAMLQDINEDKLLWNYTNENGAPAIAMGELKY